MRQTIPNTKNKLLEEIGELVEEISDFLTSNPGSGDEHRTWLGRLEELGFRLYEDNADEASIVRQIYNHLHDQLWS